MEMFEMKCLLPIVAFFVMIPVAAFAAEPSSAGSSPKSAAAATLPSSANKLFATRLALRDLWRAHIFWVRAAVVATHDNNEAAYNTAEAQAVANAKAIAASVEPFYGQQGSTKLFELLGGHWGAIKAYLLAKDGGNQAAASAAEKSLFVNSEQIATFLSSANPNWPKQGLLTMLNAHAGLHLRQINQIYAGQYDQEAETWKAFVGNVTGMGDALAMGLAKQFPDKF